jgi:hypothetical protein
MSIHLRLVSDQDVIEAATPHESPKIAVSMRQVLPLLIDAVRTNRQWLEDFSDETIEVSPDLYAVLLAYKEMRCAG